VTTFTNVTFTTFNIRNSSNVFQQVEKANAIHDKMTLRNVSSVIIQKHYRGHLSRNAASRWKFEIESARAWNALCQASAIAISRYWRGYSGRIRAEKLTIDLTNYIIELRRAEAEFEDDEYWESLHFGKQRRDRYSRRQKKLGTLEE